MIMMLVWSWLNESGTYKNVSFLSAVYAFYVLPNFQLGEHNRAIIRLHGGSFRTSVIPWLLNSLNRIPWLYLDHPNSLTFPDFSGFSRKWPPWLRISIVSMETYWMVQDNDTKIRRQQLLTKEGRYHFICIPWDVAKSIRKFFWSSSKRRGTHWAVTKFVYDTMDRLTPTCAGIALI